jgi:hypothetical protein
MIALTVGFSIILLRYAGTQRAALAIALMWAASCIISGASIGFLFGIPRVVQGATDEKSAKPKNWTPVEEPGPSANSLSDGPRHRALSYRQEVNSNLIEISDWLTKIIVGLGLVNLRQIPDLLDKGAVTLARGLAKECTGLMPYDQYAFATALIVGFSALGFFMGYLYTRLFLAGAFSRADRTVDNLIARTEKIIEEERPKDPSGSGAEVATWQVRAAERISDSSQAQNISATLLTLRRLAAEYDRLRTELPSGDVRTRRMTDVMVRMRVLALAGYPELPRFADSASPGNRLVAVAMLQVQPDPAYFSWLLDRISREKPFIAYNAIEAFRRATEFGKYNDALRVLFTDWLKTPKAQSFLAEDNDRTRLLKQVLRHLDIAV